MMEEKQLKKLFLFRKLGAFSVVREKPREAFKSINYAVKLLSEQANRTLWIFPQGEILPNDRRPIVFFGGLAKIVQQTEKCLVASLSIRYEFLGEFKPRIFVRIERPELLSVDFGFDSKRLTKNFAGQLTENLDSLKNDVINQNFAGYKTIF